MTGRTDGLRQGRPDRWLHCPPPPGTRLGSSRVVRRTRESSGQNRVALNRMASANIYNSPILLKGEDKNTSFLLDKEMVPPCLHIFKFIKKSPSVANGSWVRPTSEGSLLGVHGAKFSRREETDTPGITGRAGGVPPTGLFPATDSALFKAKIRSGVCTCTRCLTKTRCQVPPCPATGASALGKIT